MKQTYDALLVFYLGGQHILRTAISLLSKGSLLSSSFSLLVHSDLFYPTLHFCSY